MDYSAVGDIHRKYQ